MRVDMHRCPSLRSPFSVHFVPPFSSVLLISLTHVTLNIIISCLWWPYRAVVMRCDGMKPFIFNWVLGHNASVSCNLANISFESTLTPISAYLLLDRRPIQPCSPCFILKANSYAGVASFYRVTELNKGTLSYPYKETARERQGTSKLPPSKQV